MSQPTHDNSSPLAAATHAVRSGLDTDLHHGAVVPPMHLSSTFSFADFGEPRQYDYTRSGNPTRDLLADAVNGLEGGAGAAVTATGMAAVLLVLELLKPEDLLVAPCDCYGGTHRLIQAFADKGRFQLNLIDPTDQDAVRRATAQGPKMVWLETPSNPLLRITDVAAVSRLAHDVGALVVVDNTFLSPVLQRPLGLGADLVIHSTTKYINGHSDVVGGAVVAGTPELAETIRWWSNCLGITGSPFDSYLTLRGLRTLHARMAQHESNALAVAELLNTHPAVRRVYYPGLPSHPGHGIAARQQDGYGAMLSFELDGGEPQLRAFLDGLRCFTLAESLGGVESLVAHPATMTHAAMDSEARCVAGITDSLLRLSVGIEARQDLLADLTAALRRAAQVGRPVSVAPTLADVPDNPGVPCTS